MKNLTAKVGEHFSDYVIICRLPTGGFVSKSSDANWAIGAAQRFISSIEARDFKSSVEE